MVEAIDSSDVTNSTKASSLTIEKQDMFKFMTDAEEDLMHMDSQADEAFKLANTYQEYEL